MELSAHHQDYRHSLEVFFEQSLVALCVVWNNRLVSVSPGFLTMFGLSGDEVIGRDLLDLVVPDDREMVRETLERLLQGDPSCSHWVFRVRHKQGAEIAVEIFARVITSDGHSAVTGVLIDVTEKMERQRRLVESEATLRHVFADITDVVFRTDPAGRWRMLNPAWEAVTGLTVDATIGDPMLDFVHPDDRAGHESALAALFRRETDCCSHTARYRTRSGTHRWMALHARLAVDRHGGILGLTGTLRDVSELVDAEERLKESRERLQDIMAVIADGVFAVDAEGRLQFLNPAAEALLGWKREEVLNVAARDVIHCARPDGAAIPAAECPIAQVLRTKTPHRSGEDHFIRKDGTLLPISYSVAPIIHDGVVHGAVGAFHDITDQMRIRQALRESERQTRMVFDQSPIPLFVTRLKDHRIVYVNRCTEELTRLPRQEVIGRFAPDFWQEPAQRGTLIDAVERDGHARDFVVSFKPGSGELLTAVVSASRTMFDGEPALIVSVNDITAQKRAEDAIRRSEHNLRLLTENMTDVVWSVNATLRYTYISPSLECSRGNKPEELIGRHILEGLTPDSYAKARLFIDDACADAARNRAAGQTKLRMELQHPRKDGSIADSEVCATLVFDADGRLTGIHGVTRDIGERKRLETELLRRATIDDLTGLDNRREFLAHLTSEMERSRRYGHALTVGMLDIDRFKAINDTHGHAAGDAALRQFAETCRKTLRDSDVIGRVGGEEFAMFLPETALGEGLHVAERLRQAVAAMSVPCDSGSFGLTVSIGLAELHSGDTPSRILSKADQTLYRAKETGRNRTTLWAGAEEPVLSTAEG